VGGGRVDVGISGRRATPVVQAEEVKACAVVVVVPVVEAAAPAPSTEGKGCHLRPSIIDSVKMAGSRRGGRERTR